MKFLTFIPESRRGGLGSRMNPCRPFVAARRPHPERRAAFTMIEITLCLGIIGFALVAIIGVLPTGLNVQKSNREETIVDQDAGVWMNAIRSGAQGFDDLTNYVISITTSNLSTRAFLTLSPGNGLTNGSQIVGLLSAPSYTLNGGSLQTNSVVALVRALSGSAVEKAPQDNSTILDSAFSYRMIAEVVSYVPFNTAPTNFSDYPPGSSAWLTASNGMRVANSLLANLHDVRLTFRWPLLPNGETGSGRQTFRAATGGQLALVDTNQSLYFFQHSIYK